MMQRQIRVTEEQPWTRVTRDFSDLQLHVWLVAVDDAFAAGGFFVLEGAFVEAHECIIFELLAFSA